MMPWEVVTRDHLAGGGEMRLSFCSQFGTCSAAVSVSFWVDQDP